MSVRTTRATSAADATQVEVGASSIEAVPDRRGRDTLFLTNTEASGFIYVACQATPIVVGDGIPLGPGGGALVLEGYTGPIQAISANVFGMTLSIQEL